MDLMSTSNLYSSSLRCSVSHKYNALDDMWILLFWWYCFVVADYEMYCLINRKIQWIHFKNYLFILLYLHIFWFRIKKKMKKVKDNVLICNNTTLEDTRSRRYMSRIPWPNMYTSYWCVFNHQEHISKANNSQGKRRKKEHLCSVNAYICQWTIF